MFMKSGMCHWWFVHSITLTNIPTLFFIDHIKKKRFCLPVLAEEKKAPYQYRLKMVKQIKYTFSLVRLPVSTEVTVQQMVCGGNFTLHNKWNKSNGLRKLQLMEIDKKHEIAWWKEFAWLNIYIISHKTCILPLESAWFIKWYGSIQTIFPIMPNFIPS